ncbi:nanos homolog 2 [Tetranychus urticae]|uniref:Nanos-type domain-containing protein n=1 Tax=Tetranychus urticae TaxID=32264 RepID=T1JPL6_TETUR|nr:nanos homolog 2 [Tetranychus urticae]
MSSYGNFPRRFHRSYGRIKNNFYSPSPANCDSYIKINRWRSAPVPSSNVTIPSDNFRQRIPSTSSTGSASSGSTSNTSSSSTPRKSNNQSSFHNKGKKSDKAGKTKICVFCKKNREPREVYTDHTLKDEAGNTVCPILCKYTCTLCGATGPESHTISYCPMSRVVRSVFDDATAFIEFGNYASQANVP